MPFQSKAQWRWMFAAERSGEIPEGTARRWAKHTKKKFKKLPEHSSENEPKNTTKESNHVQIGPLLMSQNAVHKKVLATFIKVAKLKALQPKPKMPSSFRKVATSSDIRPLPMFQARPNAAAGASFRGPQPLTAPQPRINYPQSQVIPAGQAANNPLFKSGSLFHSRPMLLYTSPAAGIAAGLGSGILAYKGWNALTAPREKKAETTSYPVSVIPRSPPATVPSAPVPKPIRGLTAGRAAVLPGIAALGTYAATGDMSRSADNAIGMAAAAGGTWLPRLLPSKFTPTNPYARVGLQLASAVGANQLYHYLSPFGRSKVQVPSEKKANQQPPQPAPPPPGAFQPSPVIQSVSNPNSPQAMWQRSVVEPFVQQVPPESQSQQVASGQQAASNVQLQSRQ